MRLLQFVVVSIVIGLNAFCALAQSPAGTTVSTNKPTKHCLWQVKGASNTMFLLGSMHVMKDSMYPLSPEIEAAYKRSSTVAFEADLKSLESPEFVKNLMTKATYPEGESLEKNLSPAMYSLLVSNQQSSQVKVEMLDRFKPWMAAMTILMVEMRKQGFNVQSGLDKHFFARAVEDKKALYHLETLEFQMSLFTELTEKESEEFLGQTLRDINIWKNQFDLMAKAWQVGDTKVLDKLILDSFREFPLMHKKLILDRNRAWTVKLEQFLKGEKDVLVVVGAGHLVGKDSVVELLTAKGYKVEQR